MRLAGVKKTSIFDGYGVNYVIYFQGCSHNCEGCHNPSTHDYTGGYDISLEELQKDILATDIITGVTFSGGEPLEQLKDVINIAKWCRKNNLATTLFTGYTCMIELDHLEFIEECGHKIFSKEDSQLLDYIVDGKYVKCLKDIECPFRGSSNQKLLVKDKDY